MVKNPKWLERFGQMALWFPIISALLTLVLGIYTDSQVHWLKLIGIGYLTGYVITFWVALVTLFVAIVVEMIKTKKELGESDLVDKSKE